MNPRDRQETSGDRETYEYPDKSAGALLIGELVTAGLPAVEIHAAPSGVRVVYGRTLTAQEERDATGVIDAHDPTAITPEHEDARAKDQQLEDDALFAALTTAEQIALLRDAILAGR